MPYTRDIGREFWFQFDNRFLFPDPEVVDALQSAYVFNGSAMDLDKPVDLFRVSYGQPTHPEPFLNAIQPNRSGFVDLARIQSDVISAHLATNDDIRTAFEDFAEGILLDPRRLPGMRVHKMDGNPEDWVGFHRWYVFARAVELLGENAEQWRYLGHCIGMAWAIQTVAKPGDDIVNPELPTAQLTAIRDRWMNLSSQALDWAFATHRFLAPSIVEIDAHEGRSKAIAGFARVRQILQTATPTGNPIHRQNGIAQGRFWLKPYAEFVTLSIYNRPLIADPGVDRGARSALIKVLRGTLPQVPRMPRAPLPPVPDPEIQFISDWIDAGFPEF